MAPKASTVYLKHLTVQNISSLIFLLLTGSTTSCDTYQILIKSYLSVVISFHFRLLKMTAKIATEVLKDISLNVIFFRIYSFVNEYIFVIETWTANYLV